MISFHSWASCPHPTVRNSQARSFISRYARAGLRERLARVPWLLPRLDHGRQIRQDRLDAESAHVLDHITPMRPDVTGCRRSAALVGLDPPREIRILDQPVLQVMPVDEVQPADLACRDHGARLLHQRITAIVERHRMHDTRLRDGRQQVLRLGGVHRERFVRHDVLLLLDDHAVDRQMKIVGGAVVHHLDVGIVDELLVPAVRLRNS